MPKDKVPAEERIASSFKQLAVSSKNLKDASKELGEIICILEASLGQLNIGVSAWQKVAVHESRDGSYWTRDVGYTQVGTSWAIALRRTSGNEFSDQHDEEVWRFNDAPYWMRIEGVSKIPELFETLIARVDESTSKIKAKTNEAIMLAAALDLPVSVLDSEQAPAQGGEDAQ
jgi:hypothetical protein